MNVKLKLVAMALMAAPLASNVVWADYNNEHFQEAYEKLLSNPKPQNMDQFFVDTFIVNSALNQAMDKDYSTFGMISSIEDATTVYENLVSTYYDQLEGMLKTPEDKALLKSAQQAWTKFQEEEMKFYQLEESEDYVGGGTLSMVNIVEKIRSYTAYRLEVLHHFKLRMNPVNLQRTSNKTQEVAAIEKKHAAEDAELNRIYQWMMKKRLNKEADKSTFRNAQRAWLKYREAELKFSQLLADKYSNGMQSQTIDAEQYRLTILSKRVAEYKRIESSLSPNER